MRGRFKVMLILLTFVNETKIDCVLCKVCKGLNIFSIKTLIGGKAKRLTFDQCI